MTRSQAAALLAVYRERIEAHRAVVASSTEWNTACSSTLHEMKDIEMDVIDAMMTWKSDNGLENE